ncbi:germination protein YpeB [Halalkalibacillus sediminis]|uniref:Germination protein YpeB n=1 Tax=Halalkalibacillus sediminis TaxID=2018042 RepID=A0A2I0QX30_9BACI|nr:germination protein YpeB [Halalkalibacillus sediminis]PKR78865.1 germination protein YpeB [Halalkalibacillus sediminis]
MIRWVIIVVLLIGVIGTIVWGYEEHQEKNAVLIQAENNYQRAFHDLTYRVDILNEKISTVLAMNTPDNISPQLTEIWKITSEAHADVGQLPLTLLPFNKTEQFLSDIGEFSYRVAIRGLDSEPLNEEELSLLNELHGQSNEIKRELRTVQSQVIDNGLRWMDVELALSTNEPGDNTIIDGFKTVEENSEHYNEYGMQNGLTLTDTNKGDEEVELEGKEHSEEDIKQFVTEEFDLDGSTEIKITETGEGSDIPYFNVSFNDGDLHGYAEVTKKGAHTLSFLLNRDLQEATIGLHEGQTKAEELLKDIGFEDVTASESAQYDQVGIYTFVLERDDVLYYPDSIRVKVALDNGDIVGLAARDYVLKSSRPEREELSTSITEEEAIEELNPNLEVQVAKLAVIDNDIGDEVLCYEIIGTIDDRTYRVFINANDGFEERVEELKQTEAIY